MRNSRWVAVVMTCALLGAFGTAHAEEYAPAEDYDRRDRMGFFELTGAWGFQVGETEYLPQGSFDDFKYPWVHGPAVGASGGIAIADGLHLLLNYEYTRAWLVDGRVEGVLDKVDGEIDYHTLMLGLRLSRALGAGRIRAEFAGGIIFPFQTELNFNYNEALSRLPEPITGKGKRIQKFDWGPGAHGLIGYEFPFDDFLYLALNLKIQVIQSNNNSKKTKFRNFVVDFEADQPEAITADIENGDGGERPITEPVTSARAQIAFGVRF